MEKNPEQLNTLKIEHLKCGVNPIIACIGDLDNYEEELKKIVVSGNTQDVDYFADEEQLKNKNQDNAGQNTYVISTIDNSNKFTSDLWPCTSLIIAGVDKKTGKNISILTHQNPAEFLKQKKEQFVLDLNKKLSELNDKCEKNTIDAVIVGGEIPPYFLYNSGIEDIENYENSIKLLSSAVGSNFGFEPLVITGPKDADRGPDNIIYDNDNRRLYVFRPNHTSFFEAAVLNKKIEDTYMDPMHNESFLPKDVNKQIKRLRRED